MMGGERGVGRGGTESGEGEGRREGEKEREWKFSGAGFFFREVSVGMQHVVTTHSPYTTPHATTHLTPHHTTHPAHTWHEYMLATGPTAPPIVHVFFVPPLANTDSRARETPVLLRFRRRLRPTSRSSTTRETHTRLARVRLRRSSLQARRSTSGRCTTAITATLMCTTLSGTIWARSF